jgi:hypothetical protein
VGRVVARGGRLTTRNAIAIDQEVGSVVLLEKEGSAATIPIGEFDRLQVIETAPATVTGAAGRLWAAEVARARGSVKAKWPAAEVKAAATRWALATLGSRRAAALDLIVLGSDDWPDLRLPASELAWYKALDAARRGDLPAAVDCLKALPPNDYAARTELLLAHFEELLEKPELAAAAVAVVRSVDTADARALRIALAVSPPDESVQTLRDYTAGAGVGLQVAEAIRDYGPLPASATEAGPALRALAAYVTAQVTGSALAAMPVPLVDRLVRDSALAGINGPAGLPPHVRAYLRCREAPGQVDDQTLAVVGFTAEQARRAYLSSDDQRLAELPPSDAAVRHYGALRAFAADRTLRLEDVRPSAREVVRLTDELALSFAVARPVPDEVAADPSAWAYLTENGTAGKLTADADVRRRHPQFGHWLDTCLMHRALQAGRWEEVLVAGQRVTKGTRFPRIRAAALNLAAYAHWQLRRPDHARRALDDAMAAQATAGLAVNAALVAEELGTEAALPYLEKVADLSPDGALRRNALLRMIGMWQADPYANVLPAGLKARIRAALREKQDDDTYLTLLGLALAHDRAWLATGQVLAKGRLQQLSGRYFVDRAALMESRTTQTMEAVAVALSELWHLARRPSWVDNERAWLFDYLQKAVVEPFSSAADPADAVEIIVNRSVVELGPGLRLLALVGSAAAVRFDNEAQPMPAHVEDRLVLAPVKTFRQRREELEQPEAEAVARALASSVSNAIVMRFNAIGRFSNTFVERWKEYSRMPAPDYAAGRRIAKLKLVLTDDLGKHIRELRRYLVAADGLPVDSALLTRVNEQIDQWEDLIGMIRASLV